MKLVAILYLLLFSSRVFCESSEQIHICTNCKYADKFEKVVVIMLEGWSYDSLFGKYERGRGLDAAKTKPPNRYLGTLANVPALTQLNSDGDAYSTLPQNQDKLPSNLPNEPYDLDKYYNLSNKTKDISSDFYTEIKQINEGDMNLFAQYSSGQGLSMAYHNAIFDTNLGQLARENVLFDNWFHSAFGGSWINHQWLISPYPCSFPNAPSDIKIVLNEHDLPVNGTKSVSPENIAVNSIYSSNPPYAKDYNPNYALPLQKQKTIGDLLSEANITWSWFAGGWDDAVAGNPDSSFRYDLQPFNYYYNYSPNQPGRENLLDEKDFFEAIQNDTLPTVSFWKPLGKYSSTTDLKKGDAKLGEVIENMKNYLYFDDYMVIITFDSNGGRWDHVSPPIVDKFGPGTRVPTIFVSSYVKTAFVDNTMYDGTTISKLLIDRYGLNQFEDTTRPNSQVDFNQVFLGYRPPMFGLSLGLTFGFIISCTLCSCAGIFVLAAIRNKRKLFEDHEGFNKL